MNRTKAKKTFPVVRRIYLISILVLGLTGFAQMPIFKRYYIADIPGLGWLAQFYVTHYLHYLSALVLLAVTGYVLVHFFTDAPRRLTLTASGYIRSGLLGVLIVSGIFMVIRNLTGTPFSHGFIILLDLTHLGTVMALIVTGIFCLVRRKHWVR